MNIKYKSIGILTILLLTASCYLVSPTPTSSRAPTIMPTITPTPTKTSLPLQTAAETQVTADQITQTCVTASDNNSDLISRGTVVLSYLTVDLDYSVFLFDLESSSITKLSPPGELIVVWGISPNHKYMLYGYDKVMGNEWDFRLIVADSFGRLVKEFDNKFPNDPRFASYYNWQDSENIRVVLDLNDPKVLGISPSAESGKILGFLQER